MPQGILPFQYQREQTATGLTGAAGLLLYLDLFAAAKLRASVSKHLERLDGEQGWTAYEIVQSLLLLNIAGGESVSDVEQLESDSGLTKMLRELAQHGLSKRKRDAQKKRWRKRKDRVLPSRPAIFRFLEAFHDEAQEKQRMAGKAFIPQPNEALSALQAVIDDTVAFMQRCQGRPIATLDMDATLDATHKRSALYCYKGFKAFQPLNVWWSEQQLVVRSEFRDGNVPAGYQQLRVLKDALEKLPRGIKKVSLRTDTAGYEVELLRYCAEGKDPRFGVIDFAVGANVTSAFKDAVAEVAEDQWRPLLDADGNESGQQWAEVCFVPSWAGHSKNTPNYRFVAIREPLEQPTLPGIDEQPSLPFATMEFATGRWKLFGVVSNRLDVPADALIRWHRLRCGKSEEIHAVMKDDLAGGRLPSDKFGANAAWWGLMILALNLQAVFKQLALGGEWTRKRLKAIRFALIHVAARIVTHGRRTLVRVCASHPSYELMLRARERLLAIECGPSG